MNCLRRNSFGVALLLLSACSGPVNRTAANITVGLSADSAKIEIRGLDHEMIIDLLADSATTETWQSLVPVFKEGTDVELQGLEPFYPGHYTVTGDLLTFIPDTAFEKNNTYRAELNLPDPVTNEQVAGRDAAPGKTKPREFRFVFN